MPLDGLGDMLDAVGEFGGDAVDLAGSSRSRRRRRILRALVLLVIGGVLLWLWLG